MPFLRLWIRITFNPLRQRISSIRPIQIQVPKPLHTLRKYIPNPLLTLLSRSPPPYRTYPNAASEEAYWTSAFSAQQELASSNANTRHGTPVPGLIVYYSPALLPAYRSGGGGGKTRSKNLGMEEKLVYISPRTFMKWHRMVFPDSVSTLFIESRYASHTYVSPDPTWQDPPNARTSLTLALELQRSGPKGDATDRKDGSPLGSASL